MFIKGLDFFLFLFCFLFLPLGILLINVKQIKIFFLLLYYVFLQQQKNILNDF